MELINSTPTSVILDLIKRKEAHIREGKQLERLFKVYREELIATEKELHRTRDGKIMTVQSMEDSHLINTIKTYMTNDDILDVPDKYLKEAKRRGIVDQVLDITMTLEEPESLDDWL